MKILVVGCGGRENLIIHKLIENNEVFCIGSWINYDIYKLISKNIIDKNKDEL